MSELSEFNKKSITDTIILIMVAILLQIIHCAIYAGCLFVIFGLFFGALAWLFGAQDPRDVAVGFGVFGGII